MHGSVETHGACLGIMYCLVKHTLDGLYFGTQPYVAMAMETISFLEFNVSFSINKVLILSLLCYCDIK